MFLLPGLPATDLVAVRVEGATVANPDDHAERTAYLFIGEHAFVTDDPLRLRAIKAACDQALEHLPEKP